MAAARLSRVAAPDFVEQEQRSLAEIFGRELPAGEAVLLNRAEDSRPPGGPMDGGARTTDDVALVEEAMQPGEEAWVNLRTAITQNEIPRSDAQRVLSRILRTMAKTGTPTLPKFIRDGGAADDGGVKIDVDYPGQYGETALMQAAVNGQAASVQALLDAGANPNAQNADGETALMWAAAYNEVPVINLLLKRKADPGVTDTLGWTPLMVAAWAGSKEAVEALKGKSNKSATNTEGFSAAEIAAIDESPAKVQGVQKDVRDILSRGFWSSLTRRNKKGGRSKTKQTRRTRR